MPDRPCSPELVAADNAWMEELKRLHGDRAGHVMWTLEGCGTPGSKLRELFDARERRLNEAWTSV